MTGRGTTPDVATTIAAALHGDGMFSECVYCTKRRIPAPECDLWDDHMRQANLVLAALDGYLGGSDA